MTVLHMYKYKLKDLLWEMFGSVFEALKHMPELSLKSYSIITVVPSDQQLDLHLQSCNARKEIATILLIRRLLLRPK